VRGFESLRDLLGERQRIGDRDRSGGQTIRKRLAFDVLKDQILLAVCLFEPVNTADIWVVERGEDFGFALEARKAIGVRREVGGQGLDGDLPVESCIDGEIHHAHAAAAEFALDLEWANGGWVHERGVYGSEGPRCPSRLYRGQRTPSAGLPDLNALQERF